MTQIEANKQLATLAVDNFALPGDAGFPLNALYQAPRDRSEAGELSFGASSATVAPSDLDDLYCIRCMNRSTSAISHSCKTGAGHQADREGVH